MTVRIREADLGDADLATFAAIVNETTPDDPTSVDEMRWSTAAYPGASRFILETDGRPVGTASVGRIYVFPPDFDAFWATVNVLPEPAARVSGRRCSRPSRSGPGRPARSPSTSRRRTPGRTASTSSSTAGSASTSATRPSISSSPGLDAPAVDLPAGVSLTTLAERPDLIEGVHAVAVEAFADIPGGETPMAAGDLEEFRERDVDRPSIPPAAFFVATEDATGRRGRLRQPAAPAPHRRRIAWHDMTAVARDWRGRGLATALKRATIGWAIADGIDAPRSGQRHRQPRDARGQCPARLRPEPGQPHHARPAGRRHDGPMSDDAERAAERTRPGARCRPIRPSTTRRVPRSRGRRASRRRTSRAASIPTRRSVSREERHYGKLLLAMVLALMFGGFVIGIALALVFGTAP